MAKDAELERLKTIQDLAFQRKQDTYTTMQQAWERRSSARDAMNRAFEAKDRAYRNQQSAWQDYQQVRSSNGPRIDAYNAQQKSAFQNMQHAYDNASSAYTRKDGASASKYAAEGRGYKEEAQRCVVKRRRLVDEIRAAKARFEPYQYEFQRAKDAFSLAKEQFNSAKAAHEKAQADFKNAKAEFDQAVKAFRARLEKVKAENKKRRDDKRSIAERAGVPHQYRDNVWISKQSDGTVNIYFGGVGEPNGPGHGHYAMDSFGKVTYKRDPLDPHGAQNFTDKDDTRGGTLYDRRARSDKTPLGVSDRNNEDKNDRSGTFYDRNRDIDLHVTQYYDDNTRISWDTDGKTDRKRHWTNQNLNPNDPDAHTPPSDARE